jgi:hypothetical protein
MALTDQLLNHFQNKFGIVTVVNATFYKVDTDIPLISFDTLKMSNITSEGQQKEIRGGQGAELLLQYDFGRTANVEITDALVSVGSLEYLFGAQSIADGGTITALRRLEGTWKAGDDAIADIVIGRKTSTYIHIIRWPVDGGTPVELKSSGTVGSYTDPVVSSFAAGDKYVVFYTQEATAAVDTNTSEIVLKASDFPPTVRFVGETVVLDADKGEKVAFQVEIPKFKLNANFTLSFDAEGDPSVFDFSGVALSHKGDLLKIRTLGTL